MRDRLPFVGHYTHEQSTSAVSPFPVDRMIIYRPATNSEALTTVYEKYHIEKTLPTSRPMKMCDGMEAAMWVIEVRQGACLIQK